MCGADCPLFSLPSSRAGPCSTLSGQRQYQLISPLAVVAAAGAVSVAEAVRIASCTGVEGQLPSSVFRSVTILLSVGNAAGKERSGIRAIKSEQQKNAVCALVGLSCTLAALCFLDPVVAVGLSWGEMLAVVTLALSSVVKAEDTNDAEAQKGHTAGDDVTKPPQPPVALFPFV